LISIRKNSNFNVKVKIFDFFREISKSEEKTFFIRKDSKFSIFTKSPFDSGNEISRP